MRVIFAGSPSVAVPTLWALSQEHDVVAVLTREPAPVGRKRTLTPTPVARAARELGIPVIETNRPDSAVAEKTRDLGVELGIVVAYGAILKEALLSAPKNGWLNLHFSSLPEYRGASPLQHTIMDGKHDAGLTVFKLVPELDAGDIVVQCSSPLGEHETAGEALDRLSEEGIRPVLTAIRRIQDGSAEFLPQRGDASYAPKLTRSDGELDFASDAESLYARFKGSTPEPGAWTQSEFGVVKILAMRKLGPAAVQSMESHLPARASAALVDKRAIAAASGGAFELLRVQPPGKPPMDGASWLRGRGGAVALTAREETS